MTWKMPELTSPADTSSTSLFRSTPARWPTAKASAMAVHMACAMKLLSSLMMWPAPGAADVEDVLGKGLSTGSSFAKSAASAPTMTFSLPASASTGVRASGASM